MFFFPPFQICMFKQMIQGFEQFLINCSSVFSLRYSILLFTLFFVETELSKIFSKAEAKTTSGKPPFTLLQHLDDQKEVLHGYEARALRYIPKVLKITCFPEHRREK